MTYQNAYIFGRAIQGNLVIAHKVFHYLKRSNSRLYLMALKINRYKAYDQMDWRFLHMLLLKMCFVLQWAYTIMQYISIVSFSVLINGVPSTPFFPSHAIKQGDPLSPYSFLFVA